MGIISIINYDSTYAQLKDLSSVEELQLYKNNSGISWINVNGLENTDLICSLGELYNIHPLSIEDILHTEQQPKVEMFENYGYLSVKTIQLEKTSLPQTEKNKNPLSFFRKKKEQGSNSEKFVIDQVSLILMENVLLTFQEIPGDSFNNVRRRILDDIGEIRKMGTNYLAYAIIDSIVDEYSFTLNHLEDEIENFEERATKTSDDKFIEEIQETKKSLLQLKRAIAPLRGNITIIVNHEVFIKADELRPFFRDLCENLNNVIITVENNREWLSNIMEVNLSVLSHQMNKVMKVLAIISTIFIPLTFIAGIYGMNFEFMPELQNKFAYPIVLGCMGIIAFIMIIFFKIRRWF